MENQSTHATNENQEHFEMKMTFERAFTQGSSVYIKMVAYLKGKIDPDNFQAAVKKLGNKHPFLRARVEMKDPTSYSFTTRGGTFPKVIILHGSSEEDILNAIITENKHPVIFDGNEPTSRFLLLQGAENDVIIAYVHHSIADGRAVAFVLKHLLEFLADPQKPILPLTPVSLFNAVPSEVKVSPLLKRMINLINKKWAKEKVVFTPEQVTDACRKRAEASPDLYLKVKLSKEETSLLRERVHAEGVTVNAALMAAALVVKSTVEDTKDMPDGIAIAVDVRDRLTVPVGEACSILALGLIAKGHYQPEVGFWALAKTLHQQSLKGLRSNKKLFGRRMLFSYMDPTLNDAQFMMSVGNWEGTKLLRRMAERGKKIVGISITNLGGFTLPTSYPGKYTLNLVDAEFIMPIQIKGAIFIAVASLGGRLTMIFPARPADFVFEKQKEIADAMVATLRGAISK